MVLFKDSLLILYKREFLDEDIKVSIRSLWQTFRIPVLFRCSGEDMWKEIATLLVLYVQYAITVRIKVRLHFCLTTHPTHYCIQNYQTTKKIQVIYTQTRIRGIKPDFQYARLTTRVADVEEPHNRRCTKGQGLLRKDGPPTYAILSRNLVLSQFTRFLKGHHSRAFYESHPALGVFSTIVIACF